MSCTDCIRYDYVQFEENGPEWRYCHHRGIRPLTEEQASAGCEDGMTVDEIIVTEADLAEVDRILAEHRNNHSGDVYEQ